MKTALLIAALTLLVIAPLAAQPAAAHHGGWDCSYASDVAKVCTAETLQTGYDCFLYYRVDVPGHPAVDDAVAVRPLEDTYCWIL